MSDDYLYVEAGEKYEKVTQHDGVRVTLCRNRFEIASMPHGEISEQQAVQALKDLVRWRKAQEDMREPGCVPG